MRQLRLRKINSLAKGESQSWDLSSKRLTLKPTPLTSEIYLGSKKISNLSKLFFFEKWKILSYYNEFKESAWTLAQ